MHKNLQNGNKSLILKDFLTIRALTTFANLCTRAIVIAGARAIIRALVRGHAEAILVAQKAGEALATARTTTLRANL